MTISNLASYAPSAYEMLYRLGLERRRSRAMRAASCAGWLGLGMAMGSGLAMLLTPRTGHDMRERLGEQAKRARDYVAPSDSNESFDAPARAPAPASSRPTTRRS
jgi:hypothetical protein